MIQVLDLDRWPLDVLGEARGQALVARCRNELREAGMFSLTGLIRPEALCAGVAELEPLFDSFAFVHAREHNIYFDDEIGDLVPVQGCPATGAGSAPSSPPATAPPTVLLSWRPATKAGPCA